MEKKCDAKNGDEMKSTREKEKEKVKRHEYVATTWIKFCQLIELAEIIQ